MGTRSLTVVRDEKDREICNMYRQYDGYPEGHGAELAEFLVGGPLVNGMSGNGPCFNGMGCLAAAMVARFKTEPGNFYLYPPGVRDCGEEFIYTVYPKDKSVWLKVQAGAVTFFGMPGTKQGNMPVLFEGPAKEFSAQACDKVLAEVAKEIPNDFIESQEEGR